MRGGQAGVDTPTLLVGCGGRAGRRISHQRRRLRSPGVQLQGDQSASFTLVTIFIKCVPAVSFLAPRRRTWPPHSCYHSHIPTSLDMLAGVPPQPDATAWAAAAGLSRSFNLSWVLGFEDKRRSQGAAKLPRPRAKGTGARPTVAPLASDLCENMTRVCVLCVIHTGKTFKTCNDLTLTVVGCSGTDIHSSRPILRVLILHP